MKSHNQKFDIIVRGIVMTRGEHGATIEEIRSDYFKMMGEQWPLKRRQTGLIVSYLNEIDGLMMEKLDTGLCVWYIDDIGSSLDSNNNTNVAIVNQSDGSGIARNDSNGCVDSLVRRQILTTSFVSGNTGPSMSTTTTTTTTTMTSSEAITASTSATSEAFEENEHESDKLKRRLSHNDSYSHGGKRIKSNETDPTEQMLLNEQNLSLHNWKSGANGVSIQVTTSTEKENSMLASNGAANGAIECIEEIEIIDDSDYRAPIIEAELKKLQKAFPERCQIDERSNSVITISATSTNSIDHDGLVPPGYAIVGDDFMQSMISFELYGGDFTNKPDKNFSYCVSGQTVRDAYYLVFNRQNEFKARHPNIIVNVGAIDILLLRNLIDIQTEYARLVKAIITIGCFPILTTIPNIIVSPNNPNKKIIRQMVLLLNRFIDDLIDDGHHFVDLYSCLNTADYHQQPKITGVGKNLEIRLWSTTGRKKILDALNHIY